MQDRKYGSSRLAEIVIEDPHKCFVCGGFVPDDAIECPACQFPQNGDEASQRWFLGNLRVQKRDRDYAGWRVNRAYRYLFFMPVWFFLIALFIWKELNRLSYAEGFFLLGLAFLSIWIFGRTRPRLAFTLSLILYAIITIPVIYMVPKVILTTKFFILAPYIFLLFGIYSYKDWKMLDAEIGDKNSG